MVNECRIIPKANAFIASDDETTRSWLPLVKRDIPNFYSNDFIDKPDKPDDVIEDANRLYDLVNDYRDRAGQPLPYQPMCLESLDADLKAAVKEIAEAEAADKKYQEQPRWSPR